MKLAFSTNAYKRHDLVSSIESIANIGYRGVEIMCDVPHAYPPNLDYFDRKMLKEKLEKTNLYISNLNAFMLYALGDTYHPSFIEKEWSERQKRIDYTLQCIDLAADLGAPGISIEPGGPLHGADRVWALKVFREAVEMIGEYAVKKGVSVLIEPEPGLLIESAAQFLSFIRDIDSSAVGLNFDIGHFFCAGENLVETVCLLAPYTRHYHLEDIAANRIHRHLIPGEGAIDLFSVLKAIAGTGYQGYITVELYPYEENPAISAKQAYDYISPILKKVLNK